MSADLTLALPEITLLALACLVLLIDAFSQDPLHRAAYRATQAGLVAVLALVLYGFPEDAAVAFHGGFVSDALGATLKAFMLGASLIVFFYSYEYLQKQRRLKGEYFVLGLFAVLGMLIMASAGSLLSVYLGLELLSLSLYAMVAMRRDSATASEAAMKYFVLGALASGILLYGISMIYGLTGSLQLAEISAAIEAANLKLKAV